MRPYRYVCEDCGYDSGLRLTTADAVSHACQKKAQRELSNIEAMFGPLSGKPITIDPMTDVDVRDAIHFGLWEMETWWYDAQ